MLSSLLDLLPTKQRKVFDMADMVCLKTIRHGRVMVANTEVTEHLSGFSLENREHPAGNRLILILSAHWSGGSVGFMEKLCEELYGRDFTIQFCLDKWLKEQYKVRFAQYNWGMFEFEVLSCSFKEVEELVEVDSLTFGDRENVLQPAPETPEEELTEEERANRDKTIEQLWNIAMFEGPMMDPSVVNVVDELPELPEL